MILNRISEVIFGWRGRCANCGHSLVRAVGAETGKIYYFHGGIGGGGNVCWCGCSNPEVLK